MSEVNELTTEDKTFTLIIGLQNSGKTTHLMRLYQKQRQAHEEGENEPDAYFIDGMRAVSEWFNDPEVLAYFKNSDTGGRKLNNEVKGELFANYLVDYQVVVFIDNLHKVTATKTLLIKKILEQCEQVVMATTDEGQIVINLRDYIEHFEPKKIHLRSKRMIPTFDITPFLFLILIGMAITFGYVGSALMIAGFAVGNMQAWKKAKQV